MQRLPIRQYCGDVANSSTDINASVILVSVMYFTDVLMLKIWPILADTDINIGASLLLNCIAMCGSVFCIDAYLTFARILRFVPVQFCRSV